MNDAEIVKRVASGEKAAFGELYRKYYRRLAGYCYRLMRDPTAVEDVVQSVFIKAMESVKSLDKPELFYYWLFTIARNEVYATFRQTREVIVEQLDDEVWEGDSPHDEFVRRELTEVIEQAMNRLKPEYREVLILRQYENMTYAEIAAITGNTISSVESRLFKARKALAQKLAPYYEQERRT